MKHPTIPPATKARYTYPVAIRLGAAADTATRIPKIGHTIAGLLHTAHVYANTLMARWGRQAAEECANRFEAEGAAR